MSTLDNIISERKKKLEAIRKLGCDPYPEKCSVSGSIANILKNFDSLEKSQEEFFLVGRIMSIRRHGALIFSDLKDMSGSLQLLFKKEELQNNDFEFFDEYVDLGDFIEAKGVFFVTKSGEKTLLIKGYRLICKALRPLPQEWYGLSDEEERYRKRYLDLLANEDVKKRFVLRAKLLSYIRSFLTQEGYLEVDTPILQPLYGGALAEPFITHLNVLDVDMYLRIAPELYLKRLIVGGFEKVYEIGKNFRNEGMDREHNPEFSMLELYAAYKDRDYLFQLIEKLISGLFEEFKKEESLSGNKLIYQEKEIDMSLPFKQISFDQLIKDETGVDINVADVLQLRKAADLMKAEYTLKDDKAKLADLIFKKIRSKLINPTFVIDHPLDLSPLAKKKSDEPEKTLRMQFLMAGSEMMNGFAELNDPQDQKARFENQAQLRQGGEKETHMMDEDFIEALEYGMPPTAGLGIGIDRLMAILTNAPSIKEIIFFPLMRPSQPEK